MEYRGRPPCRYERGSVRGRQGAKPPIAPIVQSLSDIVLFLSNCFHSFMLFYTFSHLFIIILVFFFSLLPRYCANHDAFQVLCIDHQFSRVK